MLSPTNTHRILAVLVLLTLPCLSGAERVRRTATLGPVDPSSPTVSLFDGMQSGDLEVKFIAKSSREGKLLLRNKTGQPLNVRLPEAFAATPVLAQFGGGGGGFGGGGGGLGGGGGSQGVGGGFGGGGGGLGGGGGFGGGGGAFNVAPERLAQIPVPCVCLEHGKPDPRTAIPYQIRPVSEFTTDTRVHALLALLGSGKLDQRAAQAAAWHLADGMSWQELAAKQIVRIGLGSEPYFSPAELNTAREASAAAARLAAQVAEAAEPLPTSAEDVAR